METFEKGKKDISSFKWFTKCYSSWDDDIILSLCKRTSKQGERVCITFKNKSSERISSTGYVIVGVSDNRLYFQESDSVNGYKLSGDAKRSVIQISSPKFVEWARPRLNGYTLHQDALTDLYYIETKEIKL